MKRWMCIVLAAASVAVLFARPTPVRATHQNLIDPNDVRGRFDIRRVDMWGPHANTGYRIMTFRRWTPKVVWDAGFFIVNVDTFGTRRFDYYVLIRSTGKRMQGLLFRNREPKRDRLITTFRVWRSDERSVKFRFPWKRVWFPEKRTFFRWTAQSLYTNDFCPNVCIDEVPNNGVVVTRVRPEPTAIPTDAPTP